MSTQLLLEHDTFSKARRALIVSSIILILLSQLDVQSNSIEIFKLKLGVNKKQIVGFGLCGVIYFSYIYILDSVTKYRSSQSFILEQNDPEEFIKKIIINLGGKNNLEAEKTVKSKTLRKSELTNKRRTELLNTIKLYPLLKENFEEFGKYTRINTNWRQSASMQMENWVESTWRDLYKEAQIRANKNQLEDVEYVIKGLLHKHITFAKVYIYARQIIPPALIAFVSIICAINYFQQIPHS